MPESVKLDHEEIKDILKGYSGVLTHQVKQNLTALLEYAHKMGFEKGVKYAKCQD